MVKNRPLGGGYIKKTRRLVNPPGTSEIIADVRANGDAALVKYAKKFDHTDLAPEQFRVTAEELAAAGLGDDLPIVVLKAPVCRPAWLVEMECVAVKAENNPFPDLA